VTWKPFARVLVRKSERALTSARRDLTAGDYDSAVNRSYYAMFDIARAAVLRAGVAEDKLPRTHNGVIQLFRLHAVQSGLMDQQLAGDILSVETIHEMSLFMLFNIPQSRFKPGCRWNPIVIISTD
jgi:uncharacterized protein (UPF0332 family)